MAGINAAGKVLGTGEKILSRSDAYIGVLIDDLVTKGTNEPYRLLTLVLNTAYCYVMIMQIYV